MASLEGALEVLGGAGAKVLGTAGEIIANHPGLTTAAALSSGFLAEGRAYPANVLDRGLEGASEGIKAGENFIRYLLNSLHKTLVLPAKQFEEGIVEAVKRIPFTAKGLTLDTAGEMVKAGFDMVKATGGKLGEVLKGFSFSSLKNEGVIKAVGNVFGLPLNIVEGLYKYAVKEALGGAYLQATNTLKEGTPGQLLHAIGSVRLGVANAVESLTSDIFGPQYNLPLKSLYGGLLLAPAKVAAAPFGKIYQTIGDNGSIQVTGSPPIQPAGGPSVLNRIFRRNPAPPAAPAPAKGGGSP